VHVPSRIRSLIGFSPANRLSLSVAVRIFPDFYVALPRNSPSVGCVHYLVISTVSPFSDSRTYAHRRNAHRTFAMDKCTPLSKNRTMLARFDFGTGNLSVWTDVV